MKEGWGEEKLFSRLHACIVSSTYWKCVYRNFCIQSNTVSNTKQLQLLLTHTHERVLVEKFINRFLVYDALWLTICLYSKAVCVCVYIREKERYD